MYGVFFIPVNLDTKINQILIRKAFRLNKKNFQRFKNNYEYFFIFDKRSNKDYSRKI